MNSMLRDLIIHKSYANAALLKAVWQNDNAANNRALLELLHHIILANRYWLFLILGLDFDVDKESAMPGTLADIAELYRSSDREEMDWADGVQPADMETVLKSPFHPDAPFTVGQIMMQVYMHSNGHRAQCAMRLRDLGGTPPSMDFIVWLKDRPQADWSWLEERQG